MGLTFQLILHTDLFTCFFASTMLIICSNSYVIESLRA